MDKAVGGWKANAFIIFDYFAPDDFKFAGVDDSINKMVIGHRNASGWWYDAQASVPGSVSAGKFYNLNVVVNGLVVTVTIDGKNAFSHQFPARYVDGDAVALNKGLVGFGSQQARGWFDNIALTVISPEISLDRTEYFDDGAAEAFTPVAGSWNTDAGRYVGTATAGTPALSAAQFGSVGIDSLSYVEVEATFRALGVTGIIFDYYAANDYKFVVLDVPGQRILIGHATLRSGWVVDQAIARIIAAGSEQTLNLVLKATVVTLTLNGQVVTSRVFNSSVADGRTGVLGKSVSGTDAAASFDRFRFRTDDRQFTPPAVIPREVRIGDATVAEGNSGSRTVTITLTLNQPQGTPLTVNWRTVDGSASAGSDFAAASGTVTFAANTTTATITLTVYGDMLYESNEQFMVQLLAGPDFNLADGYGLVTITNDEAGPSVVAAPGAATTESPQEISRARRQAGA